MSLSFSFSLDTVSTIVLTMCKVQNYFDQKVDIPVGDQTKIAELIVGGLVKIDENGKRVLLPLSRYFVDLKPDCRFRGVFFLVWFLGSLNLSYSLRRAVFRQFFSRIHFQPVCFDLVGLKIGYSWRVFSCSRLCRRERGNLDSKPLA